MGQDFFRFKQFTVFHDRCAMKVGIDGVLLGAWANVTDVDTALDVGSGSGLIALMLAQRCQATIEAIDVIDEAVIQTEFNFLNSPWANRLKVTHVSLQEYAETATRKFDLIVSNPPFFVNSLNSPDPNRSVARHAGLLTHTELIINAVKLLNKTGRICLILPVDEGLKCIEFAKSKNLHCNNLVIVYPKPGIQAKRLLIELSFDQNSVKKSELTIETNERHCYSPDFIALARDFYLKL